MQPRFLAPCAVSIALIGCTALPLVALAVGAQHATSDLNSMRQSMLEILSSHPSVREAAASLEASGYAAQGALWQFFPTPSFTSQKINASATNPVYGFGYGDPRVTTISVSQPLWTGGRIYSGFRKTQAGIKADEANFKSVSQNLALSFVQVYGDWFNSQLKIKALQRSLATHQRLIALITHRIEKGVSAASDLTLAEGRMSTVTSSLEQANSQSRSALLRLEQLYGHAVDVARLKEMNTTLSLNAASQPEMVDQALAISPDVQKAAADILIAESEIGLQRSNYSPSLSVQASRQYGNFTYTNQPPQNVVGLVLATQFGAGLSSFTQVDQAKSRYGAAKAKEETVRRQITEQVMNDLTNFATTELRLASLQRAFLASEQVALSWDRQFLAGRKSWLELMNAAQELAQTELSVADAKAALLIVKWRLAINTQGLEKILAPTQEEIRMQSKLP
jgi:adhesin transport system outer membrane protein